MSEYFLQAFHAVREKAADLVGSVINSPMGKQAWTAAEDFKLKWSTEDKFADAPSATKGVSDILNKIGDSDSESNKNISNTAKEFESTITERVFSDEGWDIAMKVLVFLFILLLASFTANSMIFYPPILRLFTFVAVLFGCWSFDSVFFITTVYYLGYMLSAIYMNSNLKAGEPRHKWIPHLYALLPLRTAKRRDGDWGTSWWGALGLFIPNAITYFGEGETGIGYQYYKFYEQEYIDSIKEQIPSWNKIKETLGIPALLSEFVDHLESMNVTYKDVSGGSVSAAALPADMKAEDLFNKYTDVVPTKDIVIRKKILARLLNKFVTDKEANQDKELIAHIEKYVDTLVKQGNLDEAEEMSRLLISVYQGVSGSSIRGVGSKGADEARARLYKVLVQRQKDTETKATALDKQIAKGKADKIDVKGLQAQRAALEKQGFALKEEVAKLSSKLRVASTLPTYDIDGKDLSREISNLIGEITALVGKLSGGAATTAATTVATTATTVGATDANPELVAKFKQLNELLDTNEAVDWAELHSAKQNIQRLQALQKVVQREVDRLEPLQSSGTAEILQDFNLKTAELASIKEDIEHALDTLAKEVPKLYAKAKAYETLQKVLAAKPQPVCIEQAAMLAARRAPIEELSTLIHPRDQMGANLESILNKIPNQANVSKVALSRPKVAAPPSLVRRNVGTSRPPRTYYPAAPALPQIDRGSVGRPSAPPPLSEQELDQEVLRRTQSPDTPLPPSTPHPENSTL
jgi:hypothetical protein